MLQKVLQSMESSPSVGELSRGYGAGCDTMPYPLVERQGLPRYPVVAPLLAVCEWYSGEIFDISPSGFTCRIAHIRAEAGTSPRGAKPTSSRSVDIFCAGSCQHLLKDLTVDTVFDLPLGPLYAESSRIMLYRRSVRLATDLTDQQLDLLCPYLGEPSAPATEWRG